jgi:colanic acid/amylovoran biosynthesis glycosyltransferase
MRLLYVTTLMPFGDLEAFFIPEVEQFMRQGHEVLIVPRSLPERSVSPEAREVVKHSVGCPVFCWQVCVGALAECARHPLRAVRALGVIFRSGDLGTLVRNLAVYPKGLWLSRLARKWRADHIHSHFATTNATMAMTASAVCGIPWSCTAHRGDIAENNLLALKSARAAFIRYISEMTRNMAGELGADVRPSRTVVVHMGVILPERTEPVTHDRSTPLWLCPANLLPVKGHVYLLRALAILKQRGVSGTLRVAGDGETRNELQTMAQDLGLGPMVEFLGNVPHEEIMDWYADRLVDTVILPSIDLGNHLHEGVPVALMEAMAYCIPVISTTTGGIPELLHDGAGILVPPCDPAALADALERLIREPDLGRRLGELGRQRIEQDFAIDKVTAQVLARVEKDPHDLPPGGA